MLKRKIISELYEWRTGMTNKALLINGARQVGKTTIVRQFAKENYLAENYLAGELTKHGISLNYYDRKSKHELGFVFPEENKITVIEVKSGKDYKKHSSLDMTQALFADKINRRIEMSGNNLETEDGVLYLPLYMSMFLK